MKRIYLILILILLSGCTSLRTPEIKGVVLDAETGKPIEGAYVVASWARTYSGPGGPSGVKAYKGIRQRTDKNGYFSISGHLLINWIPYPFGQGGSFGMAVYAHGYKFLSFVFHDNRDLERPKYNEFKRLIKDGNLELKLENLKGEKIFLDNAENMRGIDPNYAIEEYRLFLKKYLNSPQAPKVLWLIGVIYRIDLKNYDSAIKAFSEVIAKYPNSDAARYSEEDLYEILSIIKKGRS